MGVSVDLAKAAADMVVKPVKAHHRQQLGDGTVVAPTTAAITIAQPLVRGVDGNQRRCIDVTRSMASVTAAGAGKFAQNLATGAVAIPFAFTEGFRNMPRLYGEEVPDYGEIHDWKSGMVVGAKSVVFGLADGLSGLAILPYKGAQTEGAWGATKGVAKGLAGLGTKTFTGTSSVVFNFSSYHYG
jgi:hypothetical protein